MRRTAATRRRLLFCQNLPPPPLLTPLFVLLYGFFSFCFESPFIFQIYLALHGKLVLGSSHFLSVNPKFLEVCTYYILRKDIRKIKCFTIFMTLDILHKKKKSDTRRILLSQFFSQGSGIWSYFDKSCSQQNIWLFLHGNREFENKSQHVFWFNIFIVFH